MHTFKEKTPSRECLIDITRQVRRALDEARVGEGVCSIYVPHTTAGVTINENADPDVVRDVISFLAEMVPRHRPYRHVEGNSDAHIKASLMGSSVQVPIAGGHLALGTWQGIYLAEFDGPRTRSVHVAFSPG